jgi:competence protein ComEC
MEPLLTTLGIETIHCLVLSHADADHIGGIPHLMNRFNIEMMIEGPDISGSNIYGRLQEIRRQKQIPLLKAEPGMELKGFEGVEVKFLGPLPGMDNNDASVIVLLDYRNVEILLTGDIEESAENRLIEENMITDIDILKVAHHGSNSSTSDRFLAHFRPETGLISAGKRNPFGHPSPLVLGRLESMGVKIFRTDTMGSIRVRTDGTTYSLSRYRQ